MYLNGRITRVYLYFFMEEKIVFLLHQNYFLYSKRFYFYFNAKKKKIIIKKNGSLFNTRLLAFVSEILLGRCFFFSYRDYNLL